MNSIEKFMVIYFGAVDRATNTLTDEGKEQMKDLLLPLEHYLKGEDTQKILTLCSKDPRAQASATFLKEQSGLEYCLAEKLHFHFGGDDYNKALAVFKKEVEDHDATVVILITHSEYFEEFPKYVVRDSDHEHIDQIKLVNELTALHGTMIYLNLKNGFSSIHYPSLKTV